MKSLLLSLVGLLFLNVGFAQHDGHELTHAKLAHEASHRIGKLVDTGKLDEMFVTYMSSLEVTPLDHTDHNGPAFKVTATAGTGTNIIEITFNMSGKYLSNKIVGRGESEVSPWTSAPGSEIVESALHYTMETSGMDSFTKDLKKAVLSQKTSESGVVQAVVKLSSSSTTKILEVNLDVNGKVLGHSIVE